MKIRNAFVSNSSSASFIIKVPLEEEEVANILYRNSDTFSAVDMYARLEECGKFFSESKFMSEKGPNLLKALDLIKIEEDKCLGHSTKLYSIAKENIPEVIRLFLESYCVYLDKTEEGLLFSRWTTIYNDFGDFGDIIKEMVFLFTVTKTPFTWEIEDM